jgi:hypothetical protein
MVTQGGVSNRNLTPPRAAAVAGVTFSVLMGLALGIVRATIPQDSANPGAWLTDPANRKILTFGLNLTPFAGVAFLWFMGVLRNRLGVLEDQFFATVFLGSGLLFVASLIGSTAIAAALVEAASAGQVHAGNIETYLLIRRIARAFLNVFAMKMAGVFMFSTCTIALRTGILPRWLAFSGFACGAVLLAVVARWEWIELIFPAWMLLLSIHVLVADLRRGMRPSLP